MSGETIKYPIIQAARLAQDNPRCLSDQCLEGPAAIAAGALICAVIFGAGGALIARHLYGYTSDTEYLTPQGVEFTKKSVAAGGIIGGFLASLEELT